MKIIYYEKKEMIPLTYEEIKFYNKQEVCHICEKNFCTDEHDENYKNKKKVKDHCHYTGKVRGAAHSDCNLKYKVPNNIPIVIHNARQDTQLIINQLAEEFKGELDCIGEIMEKYITFLYQLKNVMMVKQLQKDQGLLIVLDLCQLHYQILLITCLEFLSEKYAKNAWKEKTLTQNASLMA